MGHKSRYMRNWFYKLFKWAINWWSCNQNTKFYLMLESEKNGSWKTGQSCCCPCSPPQLTYITKARFNANEPIKLTNFTKTNTTKVKTTKGQVRKKILNLVKEKRLSEKLQGLELNEWPGVPILACECGEEREKRVYATAPCLVCRNSTVISYSIEKMNALVLVFQQRKTKWCMEMLSNWNSQKWRFRREYLKWSETTIHCVFSLWNAFRGKKWRKEKKGQNSRVKRWRS